MKRAARSAVLAMGLALISASARVAHAAPSYDPSKADEVVAAAREGGLDSFCADPPYFVVTPSALRLCPLAKQVPNCEKLVAACDRATAEPQKPSWKAEWLGDFVSTFLRTAVWFLVAIVPLWLLWLVVGATIRARRGEKLADKPAKAAVVTPDPDLAAHVLAEITDAERLLAMAADHAARGDLEHATALYLAASLAALDRRGAIRLAKHRTNGEYVRACKDEAARPELRAIVREVDRVHFGKLPPTRDGVAAVATRATSIVRAAAAAAVTALSAMLLLGCDDRSGARFTTPPDGDGLFMALLERQGADVSRPAHSLATLPMPSGPDEPVLVVNAERTILEPDAKLHLMRWVKAGGRLFLFGGVSAWPDELDARDAKSESLDVTLHFATDEDAGGDDEESHEHEDSSVAYPAHLARSAAVRWKAVDHVVATTDHGAAYAGAALVGKGLVVGVASDDLITNLGVASPPNAKAIVALMQWYAGSRAIRVARAEDGVSPPSGPIASLVNAGLGLSVAHTAAFAVLLLVGFGVRQARAKATPPPARRAWTEHVAATGTLYARAKLAPHALATYAKFVEGRLRAKMPRGTSDPAAFLALRSGEDAGHCAEVWARALASRPGDRVQGDELTTLSQLRALYAKAVKTE